VVRKLLFVLLAVAGFGTAVAVAHPASDTSVGSGFTIRAKVTRIVDGDTLQARYRGRSDRVRLIGIDTPEAGKCYAAQATAAARKLASARIVHLVGDPSQARRDRYGRLLAYVLLPNRHDLGRDLIRLGAGYVYVFDRTFSKLGTYRAAEAAARDASVGVWISCKSPPTTTTTSTSATSTTTTATTTTTTTTITITTTPTATTTPTTSGGNCAPSYPDVCIPPPPPDLDCGQIPYRNFRVIYNVASPDPHRFDGDRDGIGCES
jgi:micrococcal nuclease